jgi:uncharacterized protein (TIGR03067 family)
MRVAMCGVLWLSVVAVSSAAAPPPMQKPISADLTKIQGTWTVFIRPPNLSEFIPGGKALIQADRLKYTFFEKTTAEFEVALDSTVTPHRWNGKRIDTPRGQRQVGDLKAIYKIEGDTIIVRYHATRPFAEFPKDFKSDNYQYIDVRHKRVNP